MKPRIRIGVVTAWPDEDWHSARLLAACARRADAVSIDPASLAARVGPGGMEVTVEGALASELDAFVLARGLGRAGDPDVQFEVYRVLEASGALLVNRLEPLLAAQDKFRTSWLLARAGIRTPPAAVAQRPQEAREALAALGDAVAKPVSGSLGEGVERVRDDGAGRRRVCDRVAEQGAVYLQAYVPHPGGDLRVFVVGGRARAAIVRRPPPGDWRTNVGRGGHAGPARIGEALASVAEAAAAALELDYAGVDLAPVAAGATVLEVNGNPGWHGILEATGQDMAEVIAEHVLGRALRRRMASEHAVRRGMRTIHG